MANFMDFELNERMMKDRKVTQRFQRARVGVNALLPFNIYKPLEKRIAMVMHNIAAEQKGMGQTNIKGPSNSEV